MPFGLVDLPWKASSGPQNSVGGPMVYSHSAFLGGLKGDNIIIVGGVTSNMDLSDDVLVAYTYDCNLGRWNTVTLPRGNQLNRQGAACTLTQPGVAYTLVGGNFIVLLGGFDGSTGDAISMADIWLFDTVSHGWSQVRANLDKEQKPANRSSHSQVLMPDGVSILMHHTATLIGTNMIVAFGFTGRRGAQLAIASEASVGSVHDFVRFVHDATITDASRFVRRAIAIVFTAAIPSFGITTTNAATYATIALPTATKIAQAQIVHRCGPVADKDGDQQHERRSMDPVHVIVVAIVTSKPQKYRKTWQLIASIAISAIAIGRTTHCHVHHGLCGLCCGHGDQTVRHDNDHGTQ
ncbi:hypothetical protein BC940DRAFT_322018 [Gongronella butleri]|nr:hypothetical protein BC940DRAFT_322018 [Gongronella butleri]